jgi:hypothetical protein
MALWLYGYFATGNPPLIDWHTSTPWWIADYLPNIESEIGMVWQRSKIYWPRARLSCPIVDAGLKCTYSRLSLVATPKFVFSGAILAVMNFS